MTSGGAQPANARASRAQLLVVGLAMGALLLLLVNAILLWQLLDETQGKDSGPGSGSGQAKLPPKLPKPSGSGKSLVRDLDRSIGRITRPLGRLTSEFESANLGSISPLLADLNRNTQGLPEFAEQLRQLQVTLGGLSSRLVPLGTLAASVPRLTAGVDRVDNSLGNATGALDQTAGSLRKTNRSLGDATGALDKTGGSVRQTNAAIRELLPLISELTVTLREAKASLDHTNECLEQPVVCQGPQP
jgi:ABC-type transporter Mla subunit MlaD